MSSKILVNASTPEHRAAVVTDGKLSAYHVERPSRRGINGNIYLAKVNRVLPGMQAAFLDLGPGTGRSAYIHVSDLIEAQEADSFKIEEFIKGGETFLVQVAKGPIGDKGARVSQQISLPGRLAVFLPFQDHIGVSRRISSDTQRRKMRSWIDAARPDGTGVIIRTAAEGASEDEIKDDLNYLVKLWQDIERKGKDKKKPGLVFEDLDLVLRVVRDMLRDDVKTVWIDEKEHFERAREFAGEFLPRYKDRIKEYRKKRQIFAEDNVEKHVERLLDREVPLESGGALVIDQGEALTAIDVNTKSFVGKKDLEQTVTANNLEACQEVARQLKLRNLGGIIVVDFVDMEDEANRDLVWQGFHDALAKDNTKTNITRISELGLVEMTRKRTRESIHQLLMDTCKTCNGTGRIKNVETMAYEALRLLHKEAAHASADELTLVCNADIAKFLVQHESQYIHLVAEQHGKDLGLRATTAATRVDTGSSGRNTTLEPKTERRTQRSASDSAAARDDDKKRQSKSRGRGRRSGKSKKSSDGTSASSKKSESDGSDSSDKTSPGKTPSGKKSSGKKSSGKKSDATSKSSSSKKSTSPNGKSSSKPKSSSSRKRKPSRKSAD